MDKGSGMDRWLTPAFNNQPESIHPMVPASKLQLYPESTPIGQGISGPTPGRKRISSSYGLNMPKIKAELGRFRRKQPTVPRRATPYSMMIGQSVNGFSMICLLKPRAPGLPFNGKALPFHHERRDTGLRLETGIAATSTNRGTRMPRL